MGGEWATTPLGDLLQDGRRISYGIVQPGVHDSQGTPILRVSDIRGGRIDVSNPLCVSAAIEAQFERTRIRGGELLLTLVGTVGEAAIAPNELAGWNLARAVALVPVRQDVDAAWVMAVLRTPSIRERILARVNTTVQTTLNLADVVQLPIPLPARPIRLAVMELLGALEDKIELNRRSAETLESMARAMFRSWFVDFDPVHARAEGRPTGLSEDLTTLFPDSFGEAALPEGWRAFPLSELCKLDRTTCDPSAFGQRLVSHFSIPAYDNGRRPAVVSASDIKSLKLRLTAPIVLFSKLNPDTPRIWPIASTSNRPALASTEYLALRPARPAATYAYLALLLSSQPFIARAASMVTGTSKSHQRVQAEALMATTWVAPPTGVLEAFDNRAEPLLSRAEAARDQCETLADIRDTLLPRLISGELLIADAEQRVAAA